jgi:hypothetical protein
MDAAEKRQGVMDVVCDVILVVVMMVVMMWGYARC